MCIEEISHRKKNRTKKNTTEKMTTPMPMGRKQKKWMSLYMALVQVAVEQRPHSQPEIRCPLSITCLLYFSLIRAISLILLGFGVVQVGLSLKAMIKPEGKWISGLAGE